MKPVVTVLGGRVAGVAPDVVELADAPLRQQLRRLGDRWVEPVVEPGREQPVRRFGRLEQRAALGARAGERLLDQRVDAGLECRAPDCRVR